MNIENHAYKLLESSIATNQQDKQTFFCVVPFIIPCYRLNSTSAMNKEREEFTLKKEHVYSNYCSSRHITLILHLFN